MTELWIKLHELREQLRVGIPDAIRDFLIYLLVEKSMTVDTIRQSYPEYFNNNYKN